MAKQKYSVRLSVEFSDFFEVEAESQEEARDIVRERFEEGEIGLDDLEMRSVDAEAEEPLED